MITSFQRGSYLRLQKEEESVKVHIAHARDVITSLCENMIFSEVGTAIQTDEPQWKYYLKFGR
jgi:ABC-type polysaccharide/polyol phosphate transport system ATPase subunit